MITQDVSEIGSEQIGSNGGAGLFPSFDDWRARRPAARHGRQMAELMAGTAEQNRS